ncbi:MAG: hypothetical protein ACRCSB_02895, partial [Bacteroidales bacterium]
KMFNLVERNCGSPCPTDGSNASEINMTGLNSPCMHRLYGNAVYTCLMRDLKTTSTAPSVKLTGQKQNRIEESFGYPDTTRVVSSDVEAIWSSFEQETAGRDRYGFSIIPTGGGDVNNYYHRGLSAFFALPNIAVAGVSAVGSIENNFISFFNYYNAVAAGFSGWKCFRDNQRFLAVRCVKK